MDGMPAEVHALFAAVAEGLVKYDGDPDAPTKFKLTDKGQKAADDFLATREGQRLLEIYVVNRQGVATARRRR